MRGRETAQPDAKTLARWEQRLAMERTVEAIRQLERALQDMQETGLRELRDARAARAADKARDDAAYAAWKRDHPKEPDADR